MKSKLVKYPFKDGKRYRWDTYKMGKRFEYTWEQSEPKNYSTITPYIKVEDISDADKYNNEYAILGDDITIPSVNSDVDFVEYNTQNTLHYIRGTVGSDFKLVMVGDDPIEYATITIATITDTNYNTDWNLTRYDYNYILNNNISADELYALLLTNNPNNDELRHFKLDYDYNKWLYANPEVNIRYNISKDNNTITLNAITGAFKFSNYTGQGRNTTHIEFPTIQRITIGSGEASIGSYQYLFTNYPDNEEDYPGDHLLTDKVLTDTRYLQAYEYFVGYTVLVRQRLNASEYADNVYYVSGYTYTPPMPAYNNVNISRYPIEFYENANVVLIGYADPTTPYHEYSWGNPETAYSNFVWVNDAIKAEYSYNTTRYGYRRTRYSYDCLDVYYLRGFEKNDLGWNYYWPYREKTTDGTYMTLVPKGYTFGAVEIWDPLVGYPIGYSVDISNPLSSYNLSRVIKKSDWPSDLTNITNISPIWLGNNIRVLKPDIQLIGDQSADTITVPSGNQTILSYTLGDPTDKQHLNPKSLQINAPCEYEIGEGAETGWKVNPNSSYLESDFFEVEDYDSSIWYINDIYGEGLWYKDGNIYIYYSNVSPTDFTPNLNEGLSPAGQSYIIDGNTSYTTIPTSNEYIEYLTQTTDLMVYNDEPGYIVKNRTWLTFNTYTPAQWANGYHFQGNQWNNIGSPWAYAGNITSHGDHKMTYVNYGPCPEGTYWNVFSVFSQDETVVEDTLGNTFPTNAQTYYDNIGGLYFWGDDIVKSYVRDEYPDNGYQGIFWYHLKPEETKFITYTEATKETLNVVLDKDRYHLPHTNEYYNRDTSLYGRVVGTPTSTNEDSIPDASWRTFLGLYLGESIPFLGIVETNIPESQILGVPAYDKQINTSETLKYGTVAAASLTFTVNLPVKDAMLYNNEYLILYYDFTHMDDWERMGFFYVDSIESIDENTSKITAHDETYKLNKYVDDFLENYSGEVTLGKFYHDLLDYCDCYYDTKEADWRHYRLNNVYHAIKTTGIEVAHFVAAIAPGFVHTNIDGDIVLDQYENTSYSIGINDYTDLQYTAYNSDLLNKVRITSNNVVVGEDTYNYGSNIYFVSDNPLISTMDTETTLNSLANTILSAYRNIPAYRPAEIQFLILPQPTVGDIFSITTLGGDTYKVIAMGLSVDASGVKIKSLGTQTYPVEAQSNSQFINLINDIDSVSVDVDNLENAQQVLGQAINQNAENIEALDERVDRAESNISTISSNLSTVSTNLQNKINNDSISTSNNLTTIKINGTTVSNITNKTYVDNSISNSEAKNSVAEANNLVSVKINNNEVNEIATKAYVDSQVIDGNVSVRPATITYNGNSYPVVYAGQSSYAIMMPRPSSSPYIPTYSMFVRVATMIYGCERADGEWWYLTGATVSFN